MRSFDMARMINYCRAAELAVIFLNYFLKGPVVISYLLLTSLIMDVAYFNPWKMRTLRRQGARVYSRFFS